MDKISLAAARVNVGLSQKEAAELLKVSNKTLWTWEKGIAFPSAQKIEAICKLYNRPYDGIIFLPSNNA